MNLLEDPSMRRLADANPVTAAPLSPDEAARADLLLTRISARPQPTATKRRRVWARLVAVLAAAAAAITAGVLATAPASAEHVLLEAARNVMHQPVVDGQFWYVRTEIDDPQSIPYQREAWRSPDRYVLRSEDAAAIHAWEEGDTVIDPGLVRVRDLTDDSGAVVGFGDGVLLTWDELMALPTDRDALRQRLLEQVPDSGHGQDWDLWSHAVALLNESPAGPELRRALWEVLATIPDVELLGDTTDSVGRDATAVQADFNDRDLERFVLLIDPQEGTILETRTYGLDDDLLHRSTMLEQGYRPNAPAVEPPLCGPGSVPETSC